MNNINNEDDFTISFDPQISEDIDENELLESLKPYVISIEKKSDSRYEVVLNDTIPHLDDMEDITWEFIQKLTEIIPTSIIVSHLEQDG